jgi:hypothetical protein
MTNNKRNTYAIANDIGVSLSIRLHTRVAISETRIATATADEE